MLRRLAGFLILLLGLAACGGGGGGGTSVLPVRSTPVPATGVQRVVVLTLIPAATSPLGQRRRPAYVSSQTQSASLVVNNGAPVVASFAPGAANCTTSAAGRTCSLTLDAPIGTDTFVETLYAGPSATGSVLSQGQISATIVAGQNNSLNVTLGGVPASIILTLDNPTPAVGTKLQINLTVTVKDASGTAIIGSDPFVAPIMLTDSDSSGTTSLSRTELTSPADAVGLAVTYSGAALNAGATFTATGDGIAATSETSATLVPKAVIAPVSFNDYTTFGFDNQRDVFNPNSTELTPSAIGNLHLAWQASLGGTGDYNTQTQPVLVTQIPNHAGLLLVGGGTGNMYAYDATTGAAIWQHNLGQEEYTCENSTTFYFGIGGTAAYDPASKSFYVVGNTNATPNAAAHNSLYHMDAATGAVLGQVEFAPNNIGPSELNFSHTSVTLGSNGLAYVGTAATCDISSWRGRVAAVSVPSMQLAQTFFTAWNATTQPWGGGGVWGWGGVSLDENGNVYTGIGNTDNGFTNHGAIVAPFVAAPAENSGYGESFVQLSPDLTTVGASDKPIPQSLYFTNPDAVDLDLNGTPVIFKPLGAGCDTMAAIQGKSGSLYLYDALHIGAGAVAKYQLGPTSYTDEFIGDPAYSPVTGLVYSPVPVGAGTLYPPGMIAINPGCGAPSVAWHSTFGPDSDTAGHGGPTRSVPAVSAGGVIFVGTPCSADGAGGCNGSPTPTTAAVTRAQAVRKPAICCAPPGTSGGGALWALDASNGTVLNGGKPLFTTPDVIRVPPTVDGNWVFVLDNSGDMYGLTIDPSFTSIAAKYRAADSRSRGRWESRPAIKRG